MLTIFILSKNALKMTATFTNQYGFIFQKTCTFINDAIRTSDLKPRFCRILSKSETSQRFFVPEEESPKRNFPSINIPFAPSRTRGRNLFTTAALKVY
jgi:hypothetical protein